MSIKCIAVYCGAHSGKDEAFAKGARELGKSLLENNITLVYGAGSKGIMGEVSKTVREGEGKIIGVIPKFFEDYDSLNPQKGGVGELVVKEDMHSRKKYMTEMADAFIALPGGFGTMEELVEVITWVQLGIHDKPIGLLNINNYYKGFLDWIDTAVEQGFINNDAKDSLTVSDNPSTLIEELKKVKEQRVHNKAFSYTKV